MRRLIKGSGARKGRGGYRVGGRSRRPYSSYGGAKVGGRSRRPYSSYGGKKGVRYPRQSGKVLAVGSRAQVWHGNARHTSGGLYKKDLMKNAQGRIISRRMHERGMKLYQKYGSILRQHQFR